MDSNLYALSHGPLSWNNELPIFKGKTRAANFRQL